MISAVLEYIKNEYVSNMIIQTIFEYLLSKKRGSNPGSTKWFKLKYLSKLMHNIY